MRTYITGDELEQFRKGLQAVLSKDVDVVRLSTRKIGRNNILLALLARNDSLAGKEFEAALVEATPYERVGVVLGEVAQGWFTVESQRIAQDEARRAGTDIWQTSELNDLVADVINDWERDWRPHLGGRIHARAKAALYQNMLGALRQNMLGALQNFRSAAEEGEPDAPIAPLNEKKKRGPRKAKEA